MQENTALLAIITSSETIYNRQLKNRVESEMNENLVAI